jgi:hypothetical protein
VRKTGQGPQHNANDNYFVLDFGQPGVAREFYGQLSISLSLNLSISLSFSLSKSKSLFSIQFNVKGLFFHFFNLAALFHLATLPLET